MMNKNKKLKIAWLINRDMGKRIFHQNDLNFLATFANTIEIETLPVKIDEEYMKEKIKGADICITCWGTPKLTKAVLDNATDLKVLAHGAGTPRAIIIDEVWEKQIRVFTAAPIIAIDVAETILGMMITLLKRYWQFNATTHRGLWTNSSTEVDNQVNQMKRLNSFLKVGIIGASHVGRNLISMLKPFGVKIHLYDPIVTEQQAEILGVKKVSMRELMSDSDVISVNAPNIPQTRNLVSSEMLKIMKDGTIFINTSRGPIVEEKALIEELKTGRIMAYLDVFGKEPLDSNSELTKLENVVLSPHVSGGHTINGRFEQGKYLVEQLYDYYTKGVLRNETVKDMMNVIA